MVANLARVNPSDYPAVVVPKFGNAAGQVRPEVKADIAAGGDHQKGTPLYCQS
jgi:hypothetical protein